MYTVSLCLSSSVSHQRAFGVFVGGVLRASAESVWEVEGRESEGKTIERLFNCRLCQCEVVVTVIK